MESITSHLQTTSLSGYTETYTLTFGDQAENNVNMMKIGSLANSGFTLEDLKKAKVWFEERGVECELIDLSRPEAEPAYFLIARKGLNSICDSNLLYEEQKVLEKDKKALMRGRVVNKRARHNLCFGDISQEPDYENGKGRIIKFDDLPLLNQVRNKLPEVIGVKADNLVAEGNYYYDINKTYIGYHGDSERRIVIGIRLGATFPLYYRWYHRFKPVGDRIDISLSHGDIYFMSEKAVGTDWKRSSIMTLRHGAGDEKNYKPK